MSNSILFIGDSGSTKTTQLYFLAKYYHSLYPTKKIRLVIAGGGEIEPFITSGMVDEKIVDVFDISYRKHSLADIRRIGEGYWYKDKSKILMQSPEEMERDWKREDIGLYLIDSLSGISSTFLSHLSDQEDGAGFKESWKFEEDGISIIGLQQGHYGIVQREIHKFVIRGIKRLPIDMFAMTALVSRGEDRTGDTIFGPQLAGKVLTSEAPSWFGDNFFLDEELVSVKYKNGETGEVKKKVAWFREHLDYKTNVKCLSKIRLLSELVEEFNKKFPNGYAVLSYKEGINELLRERDRIIEDFKKKGEKASATGN